MVDVGAHKGMTMEPFLRAGFDVYAFEPIEANRAAIEERFGARDELQLRSEAVSRSSGTASLQLAMHPEGGVHDHYHSLEQIGVDQYHVKGDTIEVRTISIEDLLTQGELPSRVGVLKIDTEGHDLAVLEGAASLACEVVSVEFWGPRHPLGPSPSPAEHMVKLMAERGFHFYLVIEHAPGSTRFQFSTLEHVAPTSWGNLFFFHDKAERVRAEAVAWCRRGGVRGQSPLQRQLVRLFPGRDGIRFYDVGAFRGDYAAQVLEAFPASTGFLFDPVMESAETLRRRFQDDDSIEVLERAVGESESRGVVGYVPEASATSSLLRPKIPAPESEDRVVEVTTIDREQSDRGDPPLDLLKVDTQGYDLKVLQGAERTILDHSPVILVEAIFVPLYADQASPHQVLAFLADRGYRLVRMLDVHHTVSDELAFADFLCAHSSVDVAELAGPFRPWGADEAAKELDELMRALRARQELIERLHAECQSLRGALEDRNTAQAEKEGDF